jgi:response regulator of citrate/malate metabolism
MISALVAEDDPIVAEVNVGYIERVPGFTPAGVARTGAEAVAMAARQHADLVLLDFGLPDMTGIEVCRALLAGQAQPPGIIAVTAARDADTVRAAIAHGVVQYLIKPYSFATFRDKLDRYAAYHQKLPSGQITDQPEVDRALESLRGSAGGALPKGLSPVTYDLIVAALRESGGPMSAADIAVATGVSRVSARRYLEHLHHKGLAVLTSRYGSTGRPEHRYAWSAHPEPPDPR